MWTVKLGTCLLVNQLATLKTIIHPDSYLCLPENCATGLNQRFLSNFFFFFFFFDETHDVVFSLHLQTRGSRKAIQSGRQEYNLWRKGTCFPNKTVTKPPGSAFPPLRGPVLFPGLIILHSRVVLWTPEESLRP